MKSSSLLIIGATVLLALAAAAVILHDITDASAGEPAGEHEAARDWIGCGA